ncbi:MAG: riboflavin synthase [Saprospiraceae bacterium]|jgi:riboflavin synthase
MFTGIIESLGKVEKLEREGSNLHISISSSISSALKIDQSVSHNGVCLTVVDLEDDQYKVTAIEETLNRTNLGQLKVGDNVNLERAMLSSARLDGHMVQGHVDGTAICLGVEEKNGSWLYRFNYQASPEHLLVDKGSICINGVSLTVVEPVNNTFSVAIIPFTYAHTTFKNLRKGSTVNLEFDIIGKYIGRYFEVYKDALMK